MSQTQQVVEQEISHETLELTNFMVGIVQSIHVYTTLAQKARAISKEIRATQEYRVYSEANKALKVVFQKLPEYERKKTAYEKVKSLPTFQERQKVQKDLAEVRRSIFESGNKAYELLPPEAKVPD